MLVTEGTIFDVGRSDKRVTCTYSRENSTIASSVSRVPGVQLIKRQGDEHTRRIWSRGATSNDFLHQVSLPARWRTAH